ncbi:cytochrome P450 [Apodospora peruviana]|uniref:Cytochrome P450 n=1 Tax=Apodospora peruviana TaxID=516989 RepID=A0AAE0ISW6_9PEZI|nr:cytochrome P450 [Apodospora peruviana]
MWENGPDLAAYTALGHRIVLGSIAIFAVLSFVLRYPYNRWRNATINRRHNCLPPPRLKSADKLLGLDTVSRLRRAVAERRFLPLLLDLFQETGAWTVEVNLAGNANIWTAEPDVIKTILATKSKDWHVGTSRKEAMQPIVGQNIVITEGKDWHNTRAAMRPAFGKRQFGDLSELEGHVDRLMEHLPTDGRTVVDLKPLFYMLSMDVSTEFLFGVSTNNLSAAYDAEGAAFADALDLIQSSMVKGQWLGKLGALLFPNKKLRDAVALMNRRFDKFIDMAAKFDSQESKGSSDEESEQSYNILHELTRTWSGNPNRIRSEALILLIGGRDTTASALSNMFYYLARDPEVWQKIRQECLAVAAERPTFDELRGLKYLHNCVRESLRLVNPTLDVSRTAAVDTILPRGGGADGQSPMFVRKGTNFNLWIYGMQHRKDLWGPDADEFCPKRWDDYKISSWAYSPFGGGARLCIGQQLALTETMYATFRLARKFSSIQSTDSRPWTENLSIATTSVYGNLVRLIP